ncbi:MAG: YbaK/EbsC family protein [Candidatus Bipolaricaulota bacterium]
MQVHPTAEKFKDAVREKFELDLELNEFDEGTKTAEDAAEAIGCEVAQIAKSIVMKAGNELVIVITSGVNEVDEKVLAEEVGVNPEIVGPANPDEVKSKLGWGIGGVPPFAHEADPRIFLDTHLEKFDIIWAAAGTPNAVFPIRMEELKRVANPELIHL